jgi:hypothetical protein
MGLGAKTKSNKLDSGSVRRKERVIVTEIVTARWA